MEDSSSMGMSEQNKAEPTGADVSNGDGTTAGAPRTGERATGEPPANPLDLAARQAQRQQELLAAKLADPDPKAAVLGSAAVAVLEFGTTLRTTLLAVVDSTSDPAERLERLMPGLRMYGNLVRLADKLT